MRGACVAAALSVAGMLTAGCNGLIDPSKNQTETFSGTINPQGFEAHAFSVTKNGEISIKVTALAPLDSIPVGVIWAQASSNGDCNGAVLQSGFGNLNQVAIVGQIFQGTYCVLVYDLGILTAAETYTVSVSHP
jgi:hypothetical protein